MDRNRRVWPVGAVSNTTTENLSSFTKLCVYVCMLIIKNASNKEVTCLYSGLYRQVSL